MIYLLDTDTCIHLLRGQKKTVQQAKMHSPGELVISAITHYELLYGVERCPREWREKEEGKVRLLLDQLLVLPFTEKTAGRAAALRATLESTGQSIGPMDTLIAATAMEHSLPIVTNNLAEFRRIPNLVCLNWSI